MVIILPLPAIMSAGMGVAVPGWRSWSSTPSNVLPLEQIPTQRVTIKETASDTAMIVISRAGGKGCDLPNDMYGVVNGTYQNGVPSAYDDNMTFPGW